ncbi:hypothetical protein F7P69_22285 [Cellulosimicrobium funkei]|nr:hypothetical protein [Cellulosimicrobium funkei]
MPDPERGGIDALLERIGRVATPDVDRESHAVDLAALTGHDRLLEDGPGEGTEVVLTVVTDALRDRLRRIAPVLPAAPGLTARQGRDRQLSAVVVELSALEAGPWSGAATSSRSHLMDELVTLLHTVRTVGGLSYLVPGSGPSATARGSAPLRRAADIVVQADAQDPDTEGSPGTALLRLLRDYTHEGDQD